MPELPDIVTYVACLEPRVMGHSLEAIQLVDPFILRSVDPPVAEAVGHRVTSVRRLGKRIVLGLDNDIFVIIHLMIAGRLRWRGSQAKLGRNGLVAFDFDTGRLLLTEAAKKRRARLHLVRGDAALAGHDPGGLEVLEASLADFSQQLTAHNHTLRRALTDPRLFSGIGNAYSDEILHHARLSPLKLSQKLAPDEIERLYHSTRTVLLEWVERFRQEVGDGFPEKVTAFRPEMMVHGRYQEPCPVCGTSVARIRYADNETNYCPQCQTEGRLLADRSLSRLLKKDWPRTVEELEFFGRRAEGG
ncbi:MAG: Fpg/Nei family DNA glycosylase [Vulcanimicrobiota bacterium]